MGRDVLSYRRCGWGIAAESGVLCSLFSVLCTLYSVLCTLYSVLCSLFSVLCTLYSVLCTLYSVLCTLYSVLCSLFFTDPGAREHGTTERDRQPCLTSDGCARTKCTADRLVCAWKHAAAIACASRAARPSTRPIARSDACPRVYRSSARPAWQVTPHECSAKKGDTPWLMQRVR